MRALIVGFVLWLCVPIAHAEEKGNQAADSLQAAYNETISIARRAIDRYGVSDSAMIQIQAALAALGSKPAVKEQAKFQQLHGSGYMKGSVLASESDSGITLSIARLDSGRATPVHDHLTWGVVHVLEGRDHYTMWERKSGGNDTTHVEIRVAKELTLQPGVSTYWLDPPNDLHSQEAVGIPIWELVLAGKNLLSPTVTEHRHYYDPKTGRISNTPPKL